MPRPRRFPVMFEFYGPEEHEAAFDALAASGLFTKSDLYRMAFDQFLRQQGLLPARKLNNGNAHASAA
ncbi:hypothetical protein NLM31_21030 [Bradyrhizobium sp. CCGUVB4N]|uniref:hypothetical protein n=1 Tax=Bradyrhizobium sp. CCGUVB4N TaxID=2949631 RepID=UPI0020B25F6D|nr:hypothetical protein [Bradyrhizobium sp. CCGUVB4N]MCP3382854.1 hypothetical protein [Bradyrhizobium sp. CCGUVB4N]